MIKTLACTLKEVIRDIMIIVGMWTLIFFPIVLWWIIAELVYLFNN